MQNNFPVDYEGILSADFLHAHHVKYIWLWEKDIKYLWENFSTTFLSDVSIIREMRNNSKCNHRLQ